VKNGGAPMSPTIARKVLTLPFARKTDPAVQTADALTAREAEILNLLAKGYSYKMIASEIHLSIDTIRTHIKKIYQKLHVHSVTEAVHKVFLKK
jgi:DNA-binding NarL/FixJ family response regulator